MSVENAVELIRHTIASATPAAIGKLGGTECKCLRFAERWFRPPFPYNLSWKRPGKTLYELSGVYPMRKDIFYRMVHLYREMLPQTDILVAWYNKGEEHILSKYAPQAKLIPFRGLDCINRVEYTPWTEALAGKRVLVVSPFCESILQQYRKRELIWERHPHTVLPEFEIKGLKVPLYSYMLDEPPYPDWFSALDALKAQMDTIDYDVMLVGAGAWSMPLCAHAKQQAKIGIHLGGSTQAWFGVAGKRWSEADTPFTPYINEHWITPSGDERPSKIGVVENGCYW
ncbi:MAG: hypothetical protein ACQKBW_02885 [Puniceicoccales bacterium]